MAFTPNYYGYQNPILAQQQVRLNQMEQQMYPQFQQQQLYQQSVQQPIGLNGRIVDDISTVNINEVSSDNNSPSVFLKRDLSEMYLKRYNQNGLIETFVYKLNVEEPKLPKKEEKNWTDLLNEFSEQFKEKLETIDDKLNQALSKNTTPANKGGGQK